ncbi:MAG: DUF488 domain-containing protein [Gomphosphaeria aponina SAG 52.96 = DSM 107014]|uniref:DUF488 domain-containing protein n=1 Tax=Gomphosphaeria aponina SAG 52.96 = DSM 107014 TaxID=1521640 RepID=A0A941GW03_9CHRO|nr:DUF488 domain-containing protein [Gomphosphaeria aponina SAG 52.96 = DSM 107014]
MKNSEIQQHFILTFGYGNRSNYDALSKYIRDFLVDCLIDVREKPRAWCRKWYGDQIEKFCHQQKIEYLSERALGNTSGTSHWVSPVPEEVEGVMKEIAVKLRSQTVLLLCAEMDHRRCHRLEIAEKLKELSNQPIKHLE